MSQPTEQEPLTHFTELMNELLPKYEGSGDPEPPTEARQKLLRDIRAARDIYAQDRTRAENQLLAAQQLVNALARQLRLADERLISLEDLIAEVRVRMRMRGLSTLPQRSPSNRFAVVGNKSQIDCSPTLLQPVSQPGE
ncbi:hypothetical protein BJ322DRAFT_1109131 [Thelephora terrestris]|uniref:Uncharacterized protein n=1 Tax=Thelephora terrestris TaxID=56493 RepID=A0A9P6L5K8_9AGAM|nr:hypothetical protein BJ322DRAFT_1109131 [Thelephora terrestris]